jgi:hypothetical protein
MQKYKYTTIILEKRLARWMNGCGLIVVPIGLIVIGFAEPQAFFVAGICLAIPYLLLLGKHFSDRSDKGNIVISPTAIHLGKDRSITQRYPDDESDESMGRGHGLWGKGHGAEGQEGRVLDGLTTINWNELGEIRSTTHTSRIQSSSGGDIDVETDVLHLTKKGKDGTEKHYRMDFSQWGGRFVKGHVGFYTAQRAIELIKNLLEAASEEERVEIIKNSKGVPTLEHKRRMRMVPFGNRKVLLCEVCTINSVYDDRIPEDERECPSCGSRPIQ